MQLQSTAPNGEQQPIVSFTAKRPVYYQKTISKAVTCHGIGVHSANPATVIIKPAPANTGIVFIRTDLPAPSAMIQARWDMVNETMMCTRLTNASGVTISTIEHLVAALVGMKINNAIIEVDGPEIPIMDGSSAIFVDLIQGAGTTTLESPIPSIRILKTVEVTHNTSYARFSPNNTPLLKMSFNAGGRLGVEKPWTLDYAPDLDDFADLIADARTFGFYEDAQKLWAIGLAKGASLENTLVFNENGLMNEEGLRHDDELIRHKMLDAIGDLALANVRIVGLFEGHNSGHTLNNNLLRALFADQTAWRYEEWKDSVYTTPPRLA